MPRPRRSKFDSRRSVAIATAALSIALAASCGEGVTAIPGTTGGTGGGASEVVITGTVTGRNGTALGNATLDGRAYSSPCGPGIIASTSRESDLSGGFSMQLALGSADSAGLAIHVTPPAGSGLNALVDSGMVIHRQLPPAARFDTVRKNYVLQ